MPIVRAAAINRFNRGAIATHAPTSPPLTAPAPSGWQKSFCMSTTSRAVVAGSVFSRSDLSTAVASGALFLEPGLVEAEAPRPGVHESLDVVVPGDRRLVVHDVQEYDVL